MRRAVVAGLAAVIAAGCSSTGPSDPAPPRVEQRPAASAPALPADLKVTCLVDPDQTAASPTCPVVVWKGRSYWAYSFNDNRSAFGIVAYEGDVQTARVDRSGARYLVGVSVSELDSTVTFTGQSGRTVVLRWSELP